MNKETNQPNNNMGESLYNWILTADHQSLYWFMLACMQKPSASCQDNDSSFSSLQDCKLSPTAQPDAINVHGGGIHNAYCLKETQQYTQSMPTPSPLQKDIFPLYLSEEDYLHLATFQSNTQTSYSSEEPHQYNQIKKENASPPYILPLCLNEPNYLQFPQYQPTPNQSNYQYQTTEKINNDEMEQYENNVKTSPKAKNKISKSQYSYPVPSYYKPNPVKLDEKKPTYPGTSTWNYKPKLMKLGQGETVLNFAETNSNNNLKPTRKRFKTNQISEEPHFFSPKNKQKKIANEESSQITPAQNKR